MTTPLPPLTPIETAAMQIVVALSGIGDSPIVAKHNSSSIAVIWKLKSRRLAGGMKKRSAVAEVCFGDEFALSSGTISVSFLVHAGMIPEFQTGGFVWDGTIPEKFADIVGRDCRPWR